MVVEVLVVVMNLEEMLMVELAVVAVVFMVLTLLELQELQTLAVAVEAVVLVLDLMVVLVDLVLSSLHTKDHKEESVLVQQLIQHPDLDLPSTNLPQLVISDLWDKYSN
tara:strand:+ start:696 stop:1022 length:327 start_codon:yes stop_codon:yes gene_type:complete